MKNKIFIFIFFAVCIAPLIAMCIPNPNQNAANEELNKMPSILDDGEKINLDYLKDFSDYFDDSFGFREQMICAEHKIVAALFGESSEEKVILGKDGWLFYKETLGDYQRTNNFSDRDIYSVCRTLTLMDEYCTEQGMHFIFTIAPNKNSLYPQKMPYYYPKGEGLSNAERIRKRLCDSEVTYVNLFDLFSKEDKELYRKTDSHWTQEGAGFAADCIMEAINKSADTFYGSETIEKPTEAGDLYEMLYPSSWDDSCDVVYTKELEFEYERPIRSVEDNFIRTVNVGKEGSLFMFRDSFGNSLHSFMAEQFGKSVFCRLIPYNLTLAKDENADTVIVEIVERNLDWVLSKSAIFPAPKRDALAENCKDITNETSLKYSKSIDMEGYYKIEGQYAKAFQDGENIYIAAGQSVYEATPCTQNSFVAYIKADEILNKSVTVFVGNSNL